MATATNATLGKKLVNLDALKTALPFILFGSVTTSEYVALPSSTTRTATATIEFGKEFSNPPLVVATPKENSDNYKISVNVMSVTTTRCVLSLAYDSIDATDGSTNAKRSINWIAIGERK